MRDAYRIRRVIWPQDLVVSSISGDRIYYPEFYIEHINTGCVLSMKEYQKIRKEQVESEFVDPYPDHDNTYMNEYYKDIREEIVDKFNDSLDYMTREDIVGKEAVPGKKWKVVDGELVAVDNR